MCSNFLIIFSLYLSEFFLRKLINIQKCIKPPTKTTTFITMECSHNLMSQKSCPAIDKINNIIIYVYVEIPKHSFVLVVFSEENSKFKNGLVWRFVITIKWKKVIKVTKSLYLVFNVYPKYGRMIKDLYFIFYYSQIWLNLPRDDLHFFFTSSYGW